MPLCIFLIQTALFSFKQTHFLDFHYFDWYTIMLPTIFITTYYSTIILGNMYVFIRDGEKKFNAKLKLSKGLNDKQGVSSRSRAGRSTASALSVASTHSDIQMKKIAKRGKLLRLAIFLSEYLFVILIVLICVRYANYELKMESSNRLKLASVLIFSANIILHVYCFVYTVVKPLITFKNIYDGDAQSTKNMKF